MDVIAFARNHFHSRARADQRDHRNPHLLRANRDEETHDAVTGKTGKTAATRNRGDERSRDGHVNGRERVTSKNSMPLKRTTMEKRSISETETAETDTPAVAAVAAVAESANRAESAKALAARARFLERKRRKE